MHLRADLLLEATDALLKELVDVRRDDRNELEALEQRRAFVGGFLQHAPTEVEIGQLAIEIQLAGAQVVRIRFVGDAAGGGTTWQRSEQIGIEQTIAGVRFDALRHRDPQHLGIG